MANLGRYACVAIPFLLTLASLIALLVAALAGISDKGLYMFQVDTSNLSVSPLSIESVIDAATKRSALPEDLLDKAADILDDAGLDSGIVKAATGNNLTAADLGLFDLYDISLWRYCYKPQNGSRGCTKSQFDWAHKEINTTTGSINDLIKIANTVGGQNITIPKEITDALDAFSTVIRWTEVVFIIAVVALGVELFFGIFANCSRAFSCVTALVASFATVAVCASAALATATSAIVVGAIEATAKFYGVSGSLNTRFLATVWVAAAFAIAAGFFWVFTCCCCAPDHSSRRSRGSSSYRDSTHEKLIPGGSSPYQPVAGGSAHPYQPQYAPQQNYAAYAAPNSRYESYSHKPVGV